MRKDEASRFQPRGRGVDALNSLQREIVRDDGESTHWEFWSVRLQALLLKFWCHV